MRYPTAIRPGWVPLQIAPFTLRRNLEPTDRDLEEDAGFEYHLAVGAPGSTTVSVDWSAGLVEIRVRRPDDGGTDVDCDGGGDDYHACVRAHPSRLRSAASRSLQPGVAAVVASLVDDFWLALTARHQALIAARILEVHARGGPRAVDGFRMLPADVFAASTVDWAAGTCTSPDGHVYFSIHVAQPEAPRSRAAGEAAAAPKRTMTGAETFAAVTDSSGESDGMDVRAACRFLGVSKSSLDKWRLTGNGPPFHRIGTRVRYLKIDLEAWRNRRRDPGHPP